MKTENKIRDARKTGNRRPVEAKPVAVRAWTPQPFPLSREEVRRIVIDQIG